MHVFVQYALTIRIMRVIIYTGGEEMTAKKLIKILNADGWTEKTQKGSHLQLIHPIKSGKVTVPIHKNDLDIKTYNSILKQAGLK